MVPKKEIENKISELTKMVADLPEGIGKSNALSALSDLHNIIEASLDSEGGTVPEAIYAGKSAFRKQLPVAGDGLVACC